MKKRRKWKFQFGLRTLLLFVVLVACVLSAWKSLPVSVETKGSAVIVRSWVPIKSVVTDTGFEVEFEERASLWPPGLGPHLHWTEQPDPNGGTWIYWKEIRLHRRGPCCKEFVVRTMLGDRYFCSIKEDPPSYSRQSIPVGWKVALSD